LKEFFDTSVLMAAFWGGHVHHGASIKRFAAASKQNSACAAHSVAEVYAGMTALPVRPPIPPEQAWLFIEEMQRRLTFVALGAEEYLETIRRAATQGLASGRVYDALLLHCAAKAKVQVIYTWNLKHFQSIAPELAGHMRTP
jgi:predicted nucleic acid-binding protein